MSPTYYIECMYILYEGCIGSLENVGYLVTVGDKPAYLHTPAYMVMRPALSSAVKSGLKA